jgi:hypothetical protein
MFGEQTTQIYTPDQDSTFSSSESFEVGCLSKRSVVRAATSMAWLDNRKRIVMSSGGEPVDISDGIGATLASLDVVDDCWGFRHKILDNDVMEWVFPTEGRAFAYDMTSRKWAEDRGFTGGFWTKFLPTSYLYLEPESIHLVGTTDGRIAEIHEDAHSDLGDPNQWLVRTGFSTNDKPRDPVQVSLTARRRPTATGDISIRWRNTLGKWSNKVRKSISGTDQNIVFGPCGSPYMQRQYEIGGISEAAYSVSDMSELWQEVDF